MLLRTFFVLLGLVVWVACEDDDNEGSNKPVDNGNEKHGLAFIGDNGVANNGKGTIEVQFNKGTKAVTDAAGTEVTLTVVCGENSAEFKGELSENGGAEIEVDVSDKKEDWGVTDWGTCKVSASINVDNEEIKAEEVELKTVGQESGACEKVGGCNGDDNGILTSYEIGEEIGVQASLGGGTLQLHECTDATLFTVSDTGAVSIAANNTVTADSAGSFSTMFVLGTAGAKCVLQHTPTGGTATDHANIVAASAENKAVADLNVTFTDNNGKLKVTLPAKPTDYDYLANTVVAHVSTDSGATWGNKKADATWGNPGFDSSLSWDAANEFGYQALLRVSLEGASDPDNSADTASNSNNAAYWSLHKAADLAIENSAAGITVGQVFKVTGLPSQDQNWSINKAKVDAACGLHFFSIEKSTSTNSEYDRPMHRIKDNKDNKDIPVAIPANETSFKVLAIDKQGEAGYTAGCTIKLNIRGAIIAVGAKVDTARPSVTGIGVEAYTTNNQSKFRVILPAWDAAHGTKVASFYNVSTDGSVSWSDRGSAQWGQNNDSDNVDWGGKAENNFALVQVAVGTGSSNKIWWYYAGAQPMP